MRIPLPHGVRADVALFSVSTPRQSNWIHGFKRPLARYNIPFTPLAGNLQTTFQTLFDSAGNTTSPSHTFKLRIWYEEPDTTIKAECHAVTSMNNLRAGCRAAQWWDYVVDFTHPERVTSGNLLKAYPELASRIADGKKHYDVDTLAAIKALQSTLAGFVTVNGCPGSGKSTLATEVCDAVMQGPSIQPGWLQSITVASNDRADENATTIVDPATFNEEISALSAQCDSLDFSGNETDVGWDSGVDQAQRARLDLLKKQQTAAAAAQKRLKRIESQLDEQNAMLTDENDNGGDAWVDAGPNANAVSNDNANIWATSMVSSIIPFSFDSY